MMTSETIYAGWSTVEITPALPCWMGGYWSRTAPAQALHDPLYAQALAFGSREEPLILVICDLLDVHDSMVQEVRRRVAQALPRATTWLAATHTHSGPHVGPSAHSIAETPHGQNDSAGTVALPSRDWQDPIMIERIIAGAATAALEAADRMQAVTAAWASGQIKDVATNRDHPGSGEDTSLDLLCFYEATADDMTAAERQRGKLLAVLGSFPCHPTVLSAENLAISADLPGAFRRHMRVRLGEECWIALATGAAGDISTRHTRKGQGFDELERLGSLLAEQANHLIATARPLKLRLPRLHSTLIELEPKQVSASAALEDYARTVQQQMQEALQTGNRAQARTLETTLQGIRSAQTLAVAHTDVNRRIEISTANVGELSLVAIPGELYNHLGVEIRQSTGGAVLLLGYTNGYIGYLPSSEAYAHLDYEVLMSPFAPGSGERVRDAAIHAIPGIR